MNNFCHLAMEKRKMGREEIKNNCTTRLVSDIPAEKDQFAFGEDPGPHERVACALAELIQSDEAGGRMIGLEGGWGAGKTTVINLLRKHLLGNSNITVFSFDAWAHEGDPLRRTYLESLIRHFQSIDWIDKNNWDQIIEKITNKRKETITRSVPKTTLLGTLFALSVLLIPVGIGIITVSSRVGIIISLDWQPQHINWLFIIGLFLALSPFIVLFCNVIRIGWRTWRDRSGRAKLHSNLKNSDNWVFLEGQATTEIKQETTETPNPTSIEFEDEFEKLMTEVSGKDSKRRVVIVLDNLDRVEPKDALSIWSTLQTFLQDRCMQKEEWFSKLWIVVPYDPNGLRKLWANSNDISETKVPNNTEQHVSNSFIDKSFQLRFEVPPPVLSNWKTYLMNLSHEVLPEHHPDDFYNIYRIFNICRNGNDAPTPRELKLYVNQIGAIHRQWQDVFPIEHVAYYVILRRMQEDVRKALLNLSKKTLPYQKEIFSITGLNLVESLAGLAFNVRANVGMQLLLSAPIAHGLENNDPKLINDLKKNHQDGFWAVFEIVVPAVLSNADANKTATIALCLDHSEIFKSEGRIELQTMTKILEQSAEKVTSWSPFNETVNSRHNRASVFRRNEASTKGSKTILDTSFKTSFSPPFWS
jgi:hypothetical protein